jgi:CheY-like chemotaxis protein
LTKILIVDDELSLLWLLEQILEDLGHTILKASDGEQALELINREKPEMVISDIMMPNMDGYTLLKEIRRNPRWSRLKVILVSAAPINRTDSYQADAYLSKPYEIELLETLVEQMLG